MHMYAPFQATGTLHGTSTGKLNNCVVRSTYRKYRKNSDRSVAYFIFNLFNDVVSRSDYIVSNDSMING